MMINGVDLFIRKHEVKNSKATIIIAHGIGENSNRYLPLVEELNKNNYTVVRYDHRGHGQSEGKRGELDSYHQLIDDLHQLVEIERFQNPRKLFILGHSMGGLLVNLYGVKYGDVDGVISSAAPTNYVKQVKFLRATGYKWLGKIKVKSPFNKGDLSRIPEVEVDYLADPLNLQEFKVSLVAGMMVGGVRYLNKNIDKQVLPIIYLHGEKDPVVPVEFSIRMHDLIPSEDKEIIIYKDSVHEIFNDLDQAKVRKDVVSWLDRQIRKRN